MIKIERAVVTLRLPNSEEMDVDVPLFLPGDELCQKLLGVLQEIRSKEFIKAGQISVSIQGERLLENDTLASRGVFDGAVLEVQIV